MKNFFLFLIIFLSSFSFVSAGSLPVKNAGFMPSNIWYSKDPFYVGDSIRIYTIIFNGSTYDMTGDVEFLDNGTVLGKTNFSLAGDGRVQDLWVNWKATKGAHTITARLVNVFADGPNGKQAVILDNSATGKNERTITVDPAVTAKETEAKMQTVADAGSKALGVVETTVGSVGESIPTPIKESVSSGVSLVEQFRIRAENTIQTAKENKAKQIEASNLTTATIVNPSKKSADVIDSVTSATKEPFAYVALATLTILQYIFQWQILFYGLILYAFYRLIKWIANRIRDRDR